MSQARANEQWTNEEEELVFRLRQKGESNKKIAKVLDRSWISVKSKIGRMREEGKSIPINRLEWSNEEWNLVLELEEKGFVDDDISYELGRTTTQLRAKRSRMRKQGLYEGRKRQGSRDNWTERS